ncbi:MAG: carboxymuconolactone decarboxylase family protein [Ottowia sp.]|uniref:carboxymuconolactone decarboxylase family protein n=1 Tax=unclassified Ottowia TaxID=2645081 RepID=UPI003C2D7A03
MTRISPVPSDALSPDTAELLSTRPPYNIYRILANAPTLLPGFVQLAGALLTKTELDAQLREMVILRVGALCGSAYEIHQHTRLARYVGVTEERIRKALSLDDADGGVHGERAEDILLRFTDSVVRDVKAPASQFEAVKDLLSPRQLTELLLTIGTYMMVSRVLENLEVEIEPDGVDIISNGYYPSTPRF